MTATSHLKAGAQMCLQQVQGDAHTKGLLLWLVGRALPFPMAGVAPRLDAVRDALAQKNATAFEQAALQVIGLGPGLTPSGDDFLGGIFFVFAHSSAPAWCVDIQGLQLRIYQACLSASHPASSALLREHMSGLSGQHYPALQTLLQVLALQDARKIEQARQAVLDLGASSGADFLAGLLLALLILE